MSAFTVYLLSLVLAALIAGAAAILFARPVRSWSAGPAWKRFGPVVVALPVFLAALFGMLALFGGFSDPVAEKQKQELAELERHRFIQVLERYHPETKATIATIVKQAVAKNDPGLARDRTAVLVQQYFPASVPKASDDAVTRFAAVMLDVFQHLQKDNAETCKSLAIGGSLSDGLDAAQIDPLLDAMADVIESGASQPQPPPDLTRAQALVNLVMNNLYSANDPRLLPQEDLIVPQRAPAEGLCYTMTSFYRQVLALPKADASTVLRTMMRQR